MNLAEYQRAFMRVSLALEPSADDLVLLGDEARFRMYRHMIRTRLESMAKVAFHTTCSLTGEAAFSAAFARYLAEHGPRTPLIRDVIAGFGGFAEQDQVLLARSPESAAALRFERAKWEVAYQPGVFAQVGRDGVRELDFEGSLVLSPVLRVLDLEYPVHRGEPELRERRPLSLLVYRPPSSDDVRWYPTTPFFAALVRRAQASQAEPLSMTVRQTAGELARPLDQELLEELSDQLTLAMQRAVVAGVRSVA
jgi:hypothetical protein